MSCATPKKPAAAPRKRASALSLSQSLVGSFYRRALPPGDVVLGSGLLPRRAGCGRNREARRGLPRGAGNAIDAALSRHHLELVGDAEHGLRAAEEQEAVLR